MEDQTGREEDRRGGAAMVREEVKGLDSGTGGTSEGVMKDLLVSGVWVPSSLCGSDEEKISSEGGADEDLLTT